MLEGLDYPVHYEVHYADPSDSVDGGDDLEDMSGWDPNTYADAPRLLYVDALKGDELVGRALFGVHDDVGVIELDKIYVKHEERRKGVGTELINTAAEETGLKVWAPHETDTGRALMKSFKSNNPSATMEAVCVAVAESGGDLELTHFEKWHELGDPVEDGEFNMYVVVARVGGEFAGSAEFIVTDGYLLPNNVEVKEEYRRQGIATKMYVYAEQVSGLKAQPHSIQSPQGRALWANPNRPFGEATLVAEAVTQGFPTVKLDQVYHVGELDRTAKRKGSYEGDGLSVSLHPEEWGRIAKVAGTLYSLYKPGGEFLDIHELTDEQKRVVRRYGIEKGYAKEGTVYRVNFDDEYGDGNYMLFDNPEEAQEEADMYETEVVEVESALASSELTARMFQGDATDPSQVDHFLAVVYAEDVLDLDGVWWEDVLDEMALSAPRGTIFNGKLPEWSVVKA